MWSEFNGVRETTRVNRQNGSEPYELFYDVESMPGALASWGEWSDWEGMFDAEHGPGTFRKLLPFSGDGATLCVLCREAVAGHPAGAVVYYDHDVFELAPVAASLYDYVCRRFTEQFSHW
jgi:hypothetical protein